MMPRQLSVTSTTVSYSVLFSVCLLLNGCTESGDVGSPTSDSSSSAGTAELNNIPDVQSPLSSAAETKPLESAANVGSETLPASAIVTELIPTPAEIPAVPAARKREPIYMEEANGKELIAAALKKARRDHKHVLIEWGGNWCGWCYKLHDVFHNDAEVNPIVHEEYELVLIDEGTNHDLMLEYSGTERQYSYPHLTVLDGHGAVLTNQETGSLEEGPQHDPKLVSQFLTTWMPATIDAEQLLAESLKRASEENKRLLIRVGSPYCGWCTVLAQFVQDHESIFATDYVDLKIDTLRMTNGKEVAARYEPKESGGIPWMVILDASGKELASSFGPDGNVGYPYQPNEIAHFIAMLRETRQKLTDTQLETIGADLNAYREKRESKRH